jgi:hypothetical protein
MAESSDRALLPDETAYVTAARDKAEALCRLAPARPAIIPFEGP